ncbi:hypothetical protein [Desulfobacula sp.]|uniref:hypothetical protein n=1 Tax=Desulfobacula sp. TaxID=2593537 RepID=UPI0026335B4B|nr:hypothetical protein [Desulfobacula sp.]
MQIVQAEMHKNLMIAMRGFQKLSQNEIGLAELQVKEIIALKYQMETIAAQKGYSQACKASIPTCRGDCCKWHFPRNLSHVDFFIAIFHMPEEQQAALAKLICNNRKDQCPVLLKTGCFLSFEQRPVLCTNAYPCFNDRSYWIEKEKKNILFKKAIDALDATAQFKKV